MSDELPTGESPDKEPMFRAWIWIEIERRYGSEVVKDMRGLYSLYRSNLEETPEVRSRSRSYYHKKKNQTVRKNGQVPHDNPNKQIGTIPKGYKYCPTCTTVLVKELFYNRKDSVDGKYWECKSCKDKKTKERMRKRREED
jgi:hypothetical protein